MPRSDSLFDLEQVADYLKDDPTAFEIQPNNDFYCDPREGEWKLETDTEMANTDDFIVGDDHQKASQTWHVGGAGQGLECLGPADDWQNWMIDFGSLEGSDMPPPQGLQNIASNERHEEIDQSVRQAPSISPLDTQGLFNPELDDHRSPELDESCNSATSNSIRGHPQTYESARKPIDKSGPAWRRAKNRAAASKCRAKQRTNVKTLQETYEQGSSQNTYLKRQEQMLRGSIATLRNYALQHDSTRCDCSSLHAFNRKRAERIFQEIDGSRRSSSSSLI